MGEVNRKSCPVKTGTCANKKAVARRNGRVNFFNKRGEVFLGEKRRRHFRKNFNLRKVEPAFEKLFNILKFPLHNKSGKGKLKFHFPALKMYSDVINSAAGKGGRGLFVFRNLSENRNKTVVFHFSYAFPYITNYLFLS